VAVHFKGSGFYSTDYGRGSRKREEPTKDGPESKKTEKTEKKEKAAEA
jgi:predicted nucleic acid-binding Zn ribbon protein